MIEQTRWIAMKEEILDRLRKRGVRNYRQVFGLYEALWARFGDGESLVVHHSASEIAEMVKSGDLFWKNKRGHQLPHSAKGIRSQLKTLQSVGACHFMPNSVEMLLIDVSEQQVKTVQEGLIEAKSQRIERAEKYGEKKTCRAGIANLSDAFTKNRLGLGGLSMQGRERIRHILEVVWGAQHSNKNSIKFAVEDERRIAMYYTRYFAKMSPLQIERVADKIEQRIDWFRKKQEQANKDVTLSMVIFHDLDRARRGKTPLEQMIDEVVGDLPIAKISPIVQKETEPQSTSDDDWAAVRSWDGGEVTKALKESAIRLTHIGISDEDCLKYVAPIVDRYCKQVKILNSVEAETA